LTGASQEGSIPALDFRPPPAPPPKGPPHRPCRPHPGPPPPPRTLPPGAPAPNDSGSGNRKKCQATAPKNGSPPSPPRAFLGADLFSPQSPRFPAPCPPGAIPDRAPARPAHGFPRARNPASPPLKTAPLPELPPDFFNLWSPEAPDPPPAKTGA